MIRAFRGGWLAGGVMLAAACGSEPTPPVAPPPQRLPVGEAVTYLFSAPLDYAVSGVTTRSQYHLYSNGVFGLRYDTSPRVYLGMYRADGATITFWFDGQWTPEQGTATGTLKDGLLEIRYTDVMQRQEFKNAVYRRLP